jgi:hypothetical protein
MKPGASCHADHEPAESGVKEIVKLRKRTDREAGGLVVVIEGYREFKTRARQPAIIPSACISVPPCSWARMSQT